MRKFWDFESIVITNLLNNHCSFNSSQWFIKFSFF